MVEPLDHYRTDGDAPVEPGVYRVVGSDEGTVTMLRVVEDGRRINSGAVVRLARDDLAAFEAATDPDAGLGRLRQVPRDLAGHPLLSAGGLLLVAAGGYLLAAANEDAGLLVGAAGLAVLWLLVR